MVRDMGQPGDRRGTYACRAPKRPSVRAAFAASAETARSGQNYFSVAGVNPAFAADGHRRYARPPVRIRVYDLPEYLFPHDDCGVVLIDCRLPAGLALSNHDRGIHRGLL